MRNRLFRRVLEGELPMPKAALTLGAKILAVDSDAGSIEMEFEAKEEFTNPMGKIQGGFLAAMLDDTMGPALTATLDESQFAPTLELKTHFIAPVSVGKVLGRGRVVSKGSHICVLEGELFQGEVLVAKSTATALIRSFSSSAK